jgi:hypothetical protein
MRSPFLAGLLAVCGCIVVLPTARAQQLLWGEDPLPTTAVDHTGATLAANALVQLIVTTITPSGGTPPLLTPGGNGVSTGETLAQFVASAAGGLISGTVGDITALPGGAGQNTVLYVRVFELPGTGSGNIPLPIFDSGVGLHGWWYADQEVVAIVPDLGPGGSPVYNYLFDTTQSDWRFVQLPEPGSLVLAGLGLLLLGRRLYAARRRA